MMFISEFTTVGGVLSVALFDEVQPVVTPNFSQSESSSSKVLDDLTNTIASAIPPDLPQPKPPTK
jgi:hypothetical protein